MAPVRLFGVGVGGPQEAVGLEVSEEARTPQLVGPCPRIVSISLLGLLQPVPETGRLI